MAFKDFVARKAVNRLLAGIATIDRLVIDKPNRCLSATIRLEGEAVAIRVAVTGYEVRAGERGHHIRFDQCGADRAWLEAIANRFLAKRWLPLPKAAVIVL